MVARDKSHVLDSLDINLVRDTIYMYEFDDHVESFSAFYWNSRKEFWVSSHESSMIVSRPRCHNDEFYPYLKKGIETWNKYFLSRPQRKVRLICSGYGPRYITRVIIKKGKIISIGTVALRDHPRAWETRWFCLYTNVFLSYTRLDYFYGNQPILIMFWWIFVPIIYNLYCK